MTGPAARPATSKAVTGPIDRMEIGPYVFERRRPLEWRLQQARAPHRAFLSDALLTQLAGDGAGGTAGQIANVAALPHAAAVITTPDAHYGYGSPIGTVFASPATLSLAVVGVDISCGMSLVLTDLDRQDLAGPGVRRELLDALAAEIPMGQGMGRDNSDAVQDFPTLVQRGAAGLRPEVRRSLALERHAFEFEQDLSAVDGLWTHVPRRAMERGEATLGSLGGGNHFIEVQALDVLDPHTASAWGLRPGQVVLMLHSGSRAFGSQVAGHYEHEAGLLFQARARAETRVAEQLRQERVRRCRVERRDVGLDEFAVRYDSEHGSATITYRVPARSVDAYRSAEGRALLADMETLYRHADGRLRQRMRVRLDDMTADSDRFGLSHLEADLPFVLRPLPGSGAAPVSASAADLAEGYWTAVQAAQNFAVLSRTLMQYRATQVLGRMFGADRVGARLLMDISHNNVQLETFRGRPAYVHRKGATRAFPAGHPALAHTPWAATGHPIIVPGSMGSFSYLMRAQPTARRSLFSVNHGAGRAMSRGAARRTLDAAEQQAALDAMGTIVLGASIDEMPAAYKDIDEVVRVCVEGGLCHVVARCQPLATAKGDDQPDD